MTIDIEKQANLGGEMICIRVDRALADQLAVIGGEPPERMHITLAALEGPFGSDTADRVAKALNTVAERHPKILASLSGVGRFENTDAGEDAVVALVDAPGLEELRADLLKELKRAHVPVMRNHGFTPHITIAYVGFHEQSPVSRIGGLDMKIAKVEYVQGDFVVAKATLKGKKEEIAKVDEQEVYDFEASFPVSKADSMQRLVYGVVLVPEEVDLQNDIIGEVGIEKTAHRFLADFNRGNEMGHMHVRLGEIGIDLVESYIAPVDFTLGDQSVKKGSWVMGAKINDDDLWADVLAGRLTGFSVAGIATILDS